MKREHGLRGSPVRGLSMATLGFGAGLTSIVFYGVAGPQFKEALGISGVMLGLLLSSPHLSKAVLRIPFGAWVDEVGGKKPFLVLLGLTLAGMAGLVLLLFRDYPERFGAHLYLILLGLGALAGAGGATFSVGVPQTAFWYPARRQGYALGVYAGVGNIAPGFVNILIPVLIGTWGLAGAYLAWLVVIAVATITYGLFSVDAYYFQLVKKGTAPADARRIAEMSGQDVFPSGSARRSLGDSARNPLTWVLVFLYTVSFGGGFTALTAWFPTYWYLYHGLTLGTAGLISGGFTVYGSLIRIPGGSLSDKFGGETVAMISFGIIAFGGALLTVASSAALAIVGMLVLGTGMGVANAAIFELVPKYIPSAVGGASGWIGGIGGAGTLLVLPLLGKAVDLYGHIGYARGFAVIVVLSALCVGITFVLKRSASHHRQN